MTASALPDESSMPSLDAVDPGELVALRERTAQLQVALESRIVIEQAKGILAERYRLAVDVAFELLRLSARSSRVRIHELAQRIVSEPRTPAELERQLDLHAPRFRPDVHPA